MNEDRYGRLIGNLIGKEVIVKDEFGERFIGNCLAISDPYLNVIIDDLKTSSIMIIRNVRWIKLLETKET